MTPVAARLRLIAGMYTLQAGYMRSASFQLATRRGDHIVANWLRTWLSPRLDVKLTFASMSSLDTAYICTLITFVAELCYLKPFLPLYTYAAALACLLGAAAQGELITCTGSGVLQELMLTVWEWLLSLLHCKIS